MLLALGVATPAYSQQPESTPPVAFWKSLGDTTLERLVADVVKSNHDIVAAEARLRGARAERTQTALDFAPTVYATASFTRQRLASASFPGSFGGTAFPDQTVWDAGLQLSWELDLFGRIRKSTQGKNALVGAAEEDVRDLQVLLAAEVAINYFELRGEQDRLRVARQSAENQQHTLDVTLQRLDAGRGSEFDSERARTQLNSTLAAIPALEASVEALEHRIAVLVGHEVPGLEQERDDSASLAALPDSIVVPNADIAVRRRPDVRSAERQLAAGNAFVGAAKAEYLPRVTVGGTAGYVGASFDALSNSNTPRYAIGPVISLPLNVGRVKAGVDQARAQQSEAEAYYKKTELQASAEIATSVVAYNKARQSLDYLGAAAKASERAAALARLRFEEGASDLLQVLDAERTMLAAQDRLASGRTAATNGLVTVYRAFGGALP
ncbi:MAG TPA: efflux transporter outer membrane subunit [Myxococcales bacterium]|nr:efflux transporter outer membrane subunit [Myxococcales bacterium]